MCNNEVCEGGVASVPDSLSKGGVAYMHVN